MAVGAVAALAACHGATIRQAGPSRAGDPDIVFQDEAGGAGSAGLPGSPAVIQAERDLQRGDLDAARVGFEAAVSDEPTDLRALLGLGLTFELREERSTVHFEIRFRSDTCDIHDCWQEI